jgi:hypothetical protein
MGKWIAGTGRKYDVVAEGTRGVIIGGRHGVE